MYLKDKNHRITLRLNEQQFDFVTATAEMLGVSPSDFLRMVINTALTTNKKLGERNGTGRENDKTNFDNQL